MDDPACFTFGASDQFAAESAAPCGYTHVTVGGACFDRIGQLVHNRTVSGHGTVVVFCGHSAMRTHGFFDRLMEQLGTAKVEVVDGIGPNPTVASCQAAADVLSGLGQVRSIIAIGGGSVMDTAKVANIASGSQKSVANLVAGASGALGRCATMLVAVPTTAGSGSEVTPFATIWDFDKPRKHSLDHPSIQPTHALLDPQLTVAMDQNLTVTTACDALGHAMESLWSRRCTPMSQAVATQAMSTIVRELPRVVANPTDQSLRAKLQWASLLGGLAISQSRTAAAHAMSYALTLRFGVPHGRAVGLLLPQVLGANLIQLPLDRKISIRDVFGVGSDHQMAAGVAEFLQKLGLNETLASYGVRETDISSLAEQSAGPDRMANNIVQFERDQIAAIIRSAV